MTLQSAPGSYFSVHDDLIFTVRDLVKANDNVTYPDYKYIADVYVGVTLVARLKSVPRPDNKVGIFNISNIVRNYISPKFEPNGNFFSTSLALNQFNISVTVKFGEEYGFTTFTNVLVDSARTYFNHYNGRLIGVLTNLEAYQNKPATIRPNLSSVYSSAPHCFLSYFNTNITSLSASATSYSADGTALLTTSITTVSPDVNTMYIYDVSPIVLNTTLPGFTNGAAYYIVTIGGTPYRFNLICESQYEVYTIHFLNRLGGFDSKDFTKVSRKNVDIEKQQFGRLNYDMDSSGLITYKNASNVYNESKVVYSTQYKEKVTINSDLLNDKEYEWMQDLILSPMVYLSKNGYYLPCSIIQNNYEQKKNINDDLTNLSLTIEFGEQFNSQYR